MDYKKALECIPQGFHVNDIERYKNASKMFNKMKRELSHTEPVIANELKLISYNAFTKQLSRVVNWLNKRIKETPYCVITERLIEPNVDGTVCKNGPKAECHKNSFKSSEWVLKTVMPFLIRQPDYIVDIWDKKGIHRVLNSDVTTFVHFDDAVYSGTQKRDILKTFFGYAAWADEEDNKELRVLLCVPFMSKEGKYNIASNVFENITFSPHKKIKSIGDFKKQYPNIDINSKLGKAKTLTAFHHKLPDHLSFPASLAKTLKAIWPNPPYKCVVDK